MAEVEEEEGYVSAEDEDFNVDDAVASVGEGSDDEDGSKRKKGKNSSKEKAAPKKSKRSEKQATHDDDDVAGLVGLEAIDAAEIADVQAEAREAYGESEKRARIADEADAAASRSKRVGRAAMIDGIWRSMAAQERLPIRATSFALGIVDGSNSGNLSGYALGSCAATRPLPAASRAKLAGLHYTQTGVAATPAASSAFLDSVNQQGTRSAFLLGLADPHTCLPSLKRRRSLEIVTERGWIHNSFMPLPPQQQVIAAIEEAAQAIWQHCATPSSGGSGSGASDGSASLNGSSGKEKQDRLRAMASDAKGAVSNKKIAISETVKYAGQTMVVTKLVTAGTEAAKRATDQAKSSAARAALGDADRSSSASASASIGNISSLVAAARKDIAASQSSEAAFASSLAEAGSGRMTSSMMKDPLAQKAMGLLVAPAGGGGKSGQPSSSSSSSSFSSSSSSSISLGALVANLDKPETLSTLQKSTLDWDGYKQSEGLEDDLAHAAEGGYVDKQQFLQRVDERKYEVEKGKRAAQKAASSSILMAGGGAR